MKITKSQLRKIIKEELGGTDYGDYAPDPEDPYKYATAGRRPDLNRYEIGYEDAVERGEIDPQFEADDIYMYGYEKGLKFLEDEKGR